MKLILYPDKIDILIIAYRLSPNNSTFINLFINYNFAINIIN